MIRKILQIIAILLMGVLGGMIWQAIFLPSLAKNPSFEKFWFIREFKERETIIFPKEEIIIQENVALTEAVEKVKNAVVGVRAISKKGKIVEGSGLILTSDGLAVTLAELLPRGYNFSLFVNGDKVPFKIIKRDPQKNLVLIQLERQGLTTRGFAKSEELKEGQRVFLMGVIFLNKKPQKIVNEGIIKYFSRGFIRTNIFEKDILKGSPLFNIEGNVLGINTVDLEGKITTIPIAQIQEFAGL